MGNAREEPKQSPSDDNTKTIKDRENQLPDDGHDKWNWPSNYKKCSDGTHAKSAQLHIYLQFSYLMFLLLAALVALYLLYTGYLYSWQSNFSLNSHDPLVFKKMMYCIIMGFLGGITYDIKILYKSVARGQWHMDRTLWRIATPWVSLVLSIVVASFMAHEVVSSGNYFAITVGFFSGYFSESAIGKLYEIANLLFK